jgi:hypothetical protein
VLVVTSTLRFPFSGSSPFPLTISLAARNNAEVFPPAPTKAMLVGCLILSASISLILLYLAIDLPITEILYSNSECHVTPISVAEVQHWRGWPPARLPRSPVLYPRHGYIIVGRSLGQGRQFSCLFSLQLLDGSSRVVLP